MSSSLINTNNLQAPLLLKFIVHLTTFRISKHFSVFLLPFILSTNLSAQRLVERDIIVNPLFNESLAVNQNESRVISAVYGWGSFGNYIVDDAEHEWTQKLGMLVELYRVGNHNSLSFVSHIEFTANDRNTLGFNPRAIIWEEGFLYTKRHNNSFWQIGYFHRCKHDIDNYIEGHERSMIFGGILYKYIMPLKKRDLNEWVYLSFRSELYTILQDERLPEKLMTIKPNIEQLIGSISLNLKSNSCINNYFGFYGDIYGSINFFGRQKGFLNRFGTLHEIQLSSGVSLGLSIQGNSHFRIGLNYEYFPDNFIEPIPARSSIVSVGIMIIDPNAML